jgi:hypothetical protein
MREEIAKVVAGEDENINLPAADMARVLATPSCVTLIY